VLLAPTSPTPAFEKNQLTDDHVAMYQQDLFTVPTSLAGLPAMSVAMWLLQ
jgi:aspartyl-tRNA(Asn)/glutamyl-tRNA(Gln) amidotransferase subunit A